MNYELTLRKKQAVKIAKQLRYPDDIIQRLKDAANEFEIDRILAAGRQRM